MKHLLFTFAEIAAIVGYVWLYHWATRAQSLHLGKFVGGFPARKAIVTLEMAAISFVAVDLPFEAVAILAVPIALWKGVLFLLLLLLLQLAIAETVTRQTAGWRRLRISHMVISVFVIFLPIELTIQKIPWRWFGGCAISLYD